jgi:glucokinase
MASPTYLLGLDIGGTKTAVVLGTTAGEILDRKSFLTRTERGFEATFAELCQTAEKVLSAAPPVAAVSVAIGGPLDVQRGIIYSPPNLPGWDNIPLKDWLRERFQKPVYVEHDGNAGTLAELYFGAGRGHRNLIFLTMGTGLGAGLVLNGQLYRGTTDTAGEIGHWRIAPDGPLAYGKRGSWEGYCAGPGMTKLAAEMFPARWGARCQPEELVDLAQSGDADALRVVRRVGEVLGQGLALLVDALNPELIIIGSMAVRLGDLLLDPAREVLRHEALPGAVAAVRITTPELGEALGDVASLCAALDQGGWREE